MGRSTAEETAYAVLALRRLGALFPNERLGLALMRAEDYLLRRYTAWHAGEANCWLGKEPYCPPRVSQVFVLAALVRDEGDGGRYGTPLERSYGGDV
jgi:hypothetical protein